MTHSDTCCQHVLVLRKTEEKDQKGAQAQILGGGKAPDRAIEAAGSMEQLQIDQARHSPAAMGTAVRPWWRTGSGWAAAGANGGWLLQPMNKWRC